METKIENLLLNSDEFEWDHDVYVKDPNNISLSSHLLVLDTEEFEDPDDLDPPEAKGARLLLSVAQVQDVVANVLDQSLLANADVRLEALIYFINNDAFITLKL